jgi:hypothetical protein
VRLDIKVFEIIDDVDSLLPKIYGSDKNNDSLADHNFAYQARDNNCDIKSELRRILTKQRYLLIKAPTGYGKTREACALAKDFMVEGYRVLRITPGWLDIPKDLPADLNLQRTRVLIMLDDLNGLFRIGNYVQSPKNEGLFFTERSTYAERLVKVLDTFEKLCGQDELCVIATARDEIDEWSVLKYNSNDNLWKRFGTPYSLSRPTPNAMSDFLITSSTKCGLLIKQEDVELIVGANQGAYRNIVQNLRRLREEYTIVSKDVFIPTLNGSWKENY